MRILLINLSGIVLSVLLYMYLKVDLIEQCEMAKCPYCYGTDLCELFLDFKINLVDDSVDQFFANHLSVKNVFYASLLGEKIVLKKLAHAHELQLLDEKICENFTIPCDFSLLKDDPVFTDEILNSLTAKRQDVNNFKVCSKAAASGFLRAVLLATSEDDLKHIWTILQVNAEPLLLQLFDAKWPVQRHLGACGRLTAQTYGGAGLNSFANADWFKRAYLAYQLLVAAKNFTYDHDKFAFYLTDVSPDNIAVDDDFTLTFIDLENVILKLKDEGKDYHHNINYKSDGVLFSYCEEEICNSRVSDHNFYAVCKLLLWPKAPWPMMRGGLLHSPPPEIPKVLFEIIDLCVEPSGSVPRFAIAEHILGTLEEILYENGFNIIL